MPKLIKLSQAQAEMLEDIRRTWAEKNANEIARWGKGIEDIDATPWMAGGKWRTLRVLIKKGLIRLVKQRSVDFHRIQTYQWGRQWESKMHHATYWYIQPMEVPPPKGWTETEYATEYYT